MQQATDRIAVIAPAPAVDPRHGIAHGRSAVEAAFQASPPRVVAAGARLTQRSAAAIYRLRRGWAIRPYQWPDGRRAIVNVYLPGDLVGIDAALGGGLLEPVLAVSPLTVQAIDAAGALPALLTNRLAVLYLAQAWAEERRRLDRTAAAIARLDAPRRVAAMLLDFAGRLQRQGGGFDEPRFHLPLTQQQIGDHLGLTVVHVNRVLRALRRQGLVDLERHVVVLRDAPALERLVAGVELHEAPAVVIRRSPGKPAPPPLPAVGATVAAE